jgi:hypothetical protein
MKSVLLIERGHQIGSPQFGKGLDGQPNISLILNLYPKLSSLIIAVRCTESSRVICPRSSKKQIERYKNNKNLALLTTYTQSHETQCILRTNGSIKEAVSALAEGKRLVPVPILEMGCEVGLHGGKWGEVPEIKIMRLNNEQMRR